MSYTAVVYSYGGHLAEMLIEIQDYRQVTRHIEAQSGWSPSREEMALLASASLPHLRQRAVGVVSAIAVSEVTADVLKRRYPFYSLSFEDLIQ